MGKETEMELLFRIMLVVAEREGEGTNLVSPSGEDKWWSLWEEAFYVESLRFSVQSMNTKKAQWDLEETPFSSLVLDPLFVSHLFQLSAFSTYSALSKKKKSSSVFVLFCFQSQSCQNLFNHSQMSTAGSRCPLPSVNSSAVSRCLQSLVHYYTCVLHSPGLFMKYT